MRLSIKKMRNEFEGKTFKSEQGNTYIVTGGRFIFEKISADIDMIGALDEEYYLIFRSSQPDVTSSEFKHRLTYWVKNCHRFPMPGDYLAVTFTDEYAREHQRWGYVTSPLKEII